jgi:hypothetical protein
MRLHTAMNGPRAFTWSDILVTNKTEKKAARLGGTVNSWALVDSYPNPLMIVGKNREKLCKFPS